MITGGNHGNESMAVALKPVLGTDSERGAQPPMNDSIRQPHECLRGAIRGITSRMTEEVMETRDDQRLARIEEQLSAEIAATEKKIRSLRADLSALRRAQKGLLAGRSYKVDTANHHHRKPVLSRWKDGSDAETIRSFVRDALANSGRPLARVEILSMLKESGVQLQTKNPAKRVSKVLWEADEFRTDANGRWYIEPL